MKLASEQEWERKAMYGVRASDARTVAPRVPTQFSARVSPNFPEIFLSARRRYDHPSGKAASTRTPNYQPLQP